MGHEVSVLPLEPIHEAGVFIDGLPDRPGISHTIFSALAERHIVVDMIAQNIGMGGKAAIGFSVPKSDLANALSVLQPKAAEWGSKISSDEEVSKVSIVGTGMRTHAGVASDLGSDQQLGGHERG